MEVNIKDRLKKLLDLHDIRQSDFCRRLKVSSGYISAMRDGISFEKLGIIARYYPEIDIRVLLLGWINPISDIEYRRSGKRTYLYESVLDLEKLHDNWVELRDMRKEIESLKQTVEKQEKTIARLKAKNKKAKK